MKKSKNYLLLNILLIIAIVLTFCSLFILYLYNRDYNFDVNGDKIIVSNEDKYKNNYAIIDVISEKEVEEGRKKCIKYLEYLENKYNEKFFVTCRYYSEEFSRLTEFTAYPINELSFKFDIFERGDKILDTYNNVKLSNNISNYFIEKFKDLPIDKNSLLVKVTEPIEQTNFSTEVFNDNTIMINLSIISEENFKEFNSKIKEVAEIINNEINNYKNIYINAELTTTEQYEGKYSYLDITINKDRITSRKVHYFPDELVFDTIEFNK